MNINEITKELQKYIDELQAKDITSMGRYPVI